MAHRNMFFFIYLSLVLILCGGCATPGGFRKFYKPMFKELGRIKDNPNDQYFDIFDFHWSGQWKGDNDYTEIKFAGKRKLRHCGVRHLSLAQPSKEVD